MKIDGTTGKAELLRPQLENITEQQFESLLTVKQAAQLLSVSQSWIRCRHIAELPAARLGRLVRFDPVLLSQHLRGKVIAGNSLKPERTVMASRYQRGSVFQKGKVKTWYGIYREDVRPRQGSTDNSERSVSGRLLNFQRRTPHVTS